MRERKDATKRRPRAAAERERERQAGRQAGRDDEVHFGVCARSLIKRVKKPHYCLAARAQSKSTRRMADALIEPEGRGLV